MTFRVTSASRPPSEDLLARFMQLHPRVIDLTLGRMQRLLDKLGNPERSLPPVIHLAGTNGKGSTLSFMRAMLEAAGYSVHATTSPHLVRFHERIILNGRPIEEDALCELLLETERLNGGEEITFFEITQAAAFLAFARTPADVLLLETGLGGRLDATNVVEKPALTVITPVDMDHQEYLGDTIAKIAAEKAGIIKRGVPCILTPQHHPDAIAVIAAKAAELDVPLIDGFDVTYSERRLPTLDRIEVKPKKGRKFWLPRPALIGRHQFDNAATAAMALRTVPGFEVTEDHMRIGALSARWPARMQRLNAGPLVQALAEGAELWLDGGHNPHAARALSFSLHEIDELDRRMGLLDKPVHVIMGMLNNRDPGEYLRPLRPRISSVTAVPIPDSPNCHAPEVIADAAAALGIVNSVAERITPELLGPAGSRTLISGSLYLAGDVLKTHA